jgi:hypothetical protein
MKWNYFYVGTRKRVYLSSDKIYSDSTMVLGLTHVKFLQFLMFILTLAEGLSYAWFIYLTFSRYRHWEIGTTLIEWTKMSRLHLKIEPTLWNTVLNKNRIKDNAQKHKSCVTIPSPETFISNLHLYECKLLSCYVSNEWEDNYIFVYTNEYD